jgi:hypothetical protein
MRGCSGMSTKCQKRTNADTAGLSGKCQQTTLDARYEMNESGQGVLDKKLKRPPTEAASHCRSIALASTPVMTLSNQLHGP